MIEMCLLLTRFMVGLLIRSLYSNNDVPRFTIMYVIGPWTCHKCKMVPCLDMTQNYI